MIVNEEFEFFFNGSIDLLGLQKAPQGFPWKVVPIAGGAQLYSSVTDDPRDGENLVTILWTHTQDGRTNIGAFCQDVDSHLKTINKASLLWSGELGDNTVGEWISKVINQHYKVVPPKKTGPDLSGVPTDALEKELNNRNIG